MKSERFLIACDHGGFDLKQELVAYLESKNKNVVDLGVHENKSVPYCQYSKKLVSQFKPGDLGILVCGTGIGISLGAIKAGLNCSLAFNEYTARECRREGVKVMAIGGRVVSVQIAQRMLDQFLGLE